MSGVYGYFAALEENIENITDSIAAWNACYGKKHLKHLIDDMGASGVYLEHFSASVPEQKKPLYHQRKMAVIDAVLYNRSELVEKDDSYPALSDEELLFTLIEKEGWNVLKEVNGDFAGAIMDTEKDSITIFRDHIGIRPLYYYLDDSSFAFSTDIRGLLSIPGIEWSLNESYFFQYIAGYHYLSMKDTDFAEIAYLEAGTVLKIIHKAGKYSIDNKMQYWKLENQKIRLKNKEEYQARLKYLVEDSVKKRMDAVDGRIGSEISGGLDSSVLSILIGRLGREGCFHSWSKDPDIVPITNIKDERNIILSICEAEGIKCKFMDRNTKISNTYLYMFQNALPPFTYTLPLSQVSSWFQEEGVRAVFTGHGGDEGVSHRGKLYEQWYQKEYLACIKNIYGTTQGTSLRLLRTLNRLKKLMGEKKEQMKIFRDETNIEFLLNQSFVEAMKTNLNEKSSTYFYDPISHINSGGLRKRMDNTSFQAAPFDVRYMYPYLDYRVLEYAVSIPRHLYNDGKTSRLIYKETFGDLMPKKLKELHSKEMPSAVYTGPVSQQLIQDLNASVQKHIDMLDRGFWSKYLDFEKLESFRLPENADRDACTLFNFQLSYLVYCALIQNVLDRTRDGQTPEPLHIT